MCKSPRAEVPNNYAISVAQKQQAPERICTIYKMLDDPKINSRDNAILINKEICTIALKSYSGQSTEDRIMNEEILRNEIVRISPLIFLEKAYSPTYRIVEILPEQSVCVLPGSLPKFSTAQEANIRNYTLFENRETEGVLNILRFEELESAKEETPHKAFLEELLYSSKEVSDILAYPFHRTYEILIENHQKNINQITKEAHMIDKNVAQIRKNLLEKEDYGFAIQDYKDLVESAIEFELRLVQQLLYRAEYDIAKTEIVSALMTSCNYDLWKNHSSNDERKKALKEILNATKKIANTHLSLVERVSDAAITLVNKRRSLIFLPGTFRPVMEMAINLSNTLKMKMCDIEYRRKVINAKIRTQMENINCIKTKRYVAGEYVPISEFEQSEHIQSARYNVVKAVLEIRRKSRASTCRFYHCTLQRSMY